MIVAGWIFTALGVILSISGIVSYNDAASAGHSLYQYYDSSDVDSARILLVVGIIMLLLGVAFLIIGYVKKSSGNPRMKEHKYNNLLNTQKCLNCGNIVQQDQAFCPKCGNNLTNQHKENG